MSALIKYVYSEMFHIKLSVSLPITHAETDEQSAMEGAGFTHTVTKKKKKKCEKTFVSDMV